jgi:hypothetical protein
MEVDIRRRKFAIKKMRKIQKIKKMKHKIVKEKNGE